VGAQSSYTGHGATITHRDSWGWYHVTARGNERRAIFRDDSDRKHWLALLEQWAERFEMRIHVYVLMDNHYHLLLETRTANLTQAMQWL
jgi:REP element-mobilizing transposase RayT